MQAITEFLPSFLTRAPLHPPCLFPSPLRKQGPSVYSRSPRREGSGFLLARNDGEGEPASTVTRAHPVSPAEAGDQCVFTQSSS